ncbi:MAG: carboxyl transferase domain-containing protein, partial [Leptospirales bacterium]
SIIDLRTPRILLMIRNAFGGAYAIWNSQHVGADMVLTYPTARVAVMGPAGKEFVYKKELQKARAKFAQDVKDGRPEIEAKAELDAVLVDMGLRYEKELMNPKEALSLGSVSRVVMPEDSRRVLCENLNYLMRHYVPQPLTEPQREFH